MKTVKVFMLVIFFSILIIMSLLVFAEDSKQASDFQSNGDLIEGWYWLRDSALQNYAEWTFNNIPLGPEEITVQINALATDRPGGGGGFNAKFLLYYSLIGEGDMPLTYIPPQTVNLENVHSPDDSFGYSCQGQVTIPASTIPAASRISLRIRRDSAQDNHIAFKEDSIVLLTDATHPPNGEPSSNDDDCEGATPIQADTCTGSLGEEDAEGHRDDVDYYSIHLEEGQQITLQLTVPGNANYGISLLNPSRSSLGSSITQREIKTLDYVANSSGAWYIKISRTSGEGEYQLAIDIQDQNDAEKGQDAGDSYQGAISISPPGGTFTGLLKAGDDVDYYSIHLEEGQQITLQLTVPGNANYGISLLNPSRSSLGSSITQREIKTLDYVANSSGAWYIKISRTSGEGEYQLAIDIQDQNDAEKGQDAGDSYQGAISISPPGGTFTGLLKAGDDVDYYSIHLEEGQQITLQLTVPGNANYGISLLNPSRSSLGSSITQREIKTLDYVANSTGAWYIKISRTSGEGEYQLAIDIQDQNDAEKGQDAGDSYQGAISISPPGGTFTGLLKAGDDVDYYSIHLEEGQQITLQLTIPGNAQYGISLLNPSRSSLGSSITQREIKTLDYVANSTGAWYIKISRTSGEGEYQLVVNSTSVGSGGEDNNPPPVISSLDANQDSIEINHDVDITCNASDQDGDTLTFSWTANGVSVGANDSYLTWRAPDTAGTYTITCTVSDGKGGEDSESVSITVTEPSNGGNDNDNIGEINYRIEITTGTRIAAGTDANVYITIYDKDGHDSGEILLDDPGVNDFERGDTNTFLVTAINIEDLDYIIVRHDSTGDYPGWYVDEIQVSNEEINQEWNFFPDQWLATDEPPDYQTQGRFYPEEEGTPGGNIEYILSLTNGGGTLNSNLPIFVNADEVGNLEIDSDGDGIRQQWEDKAMEYINPYIELDEEEPWLDNQDSDYVANYVRVHPYNPFSTSTTFNSANLPQYIIFRYVVTWSMDYGRQTVAGINLPFFTSHPTDRERIFMVWKVIDSNTLKLDWVFTSSHENPDAHHAVWNADHRTCNIGEISNLSKTFERTEVMCGNLQFSNDRLIVYASEGKHALYPSCDICENVMLVDGPGPLNVGEDCGGGGRFRFYCYNVGEPVRELPDCGFIDPKVHNLILSDEKLGGTLPDILVQKLEARYELKITTGNVDRGGTDARLDVTLYGDQGSKVFSIYTNPEPPRPALYIGTFEKENTDYIYVPSLDLGEINQIRIINDNSGDGPGWYVNNIEIKDIKTNKTWSYLPNVWISEDEQLDRTFTLTQQ